MNTITIEIASAIIAITILVLFIAIAAAVYLILRAKEANVLSLFERILNSPEYKSRSSFFETALNNSLPEEEDKLLLQGTLDLPKEKLLDVICGSIAYNNHGSLSGDTMFGDLARQNLKISGQPIRRLTIQKMKYKAHQSIKSETIKNEPINTLIHKHKSKLMSLYKISETTCKAIFSNRIISAAVLENLIQKHSSTTPHPNIIHNLVSYFNQKGLGGSSCWFFQALITHNHIDSKLFFTRNDFVSQSLNMSLTVKNQNSVRCKTSIIIISYAKKGTIILKRPMLYSLEFTMSPQNPKEDFSNMLYTDIKLELIADKSLEPWFTKSSPIKRTADNKDDTILTERKESDNIISCIYSLPDLEVPQELNQTTLQFLLGHLEKSRTTQFDVSKAH